MLTTRAAILGVLPVEAGSHSQCGASIVTTRLKVKHADDSETRYSIASSQAKIMSVKLASATDPV